MHWNYLELHYTFRGKNIVVLWTLCRQKKRRIRQRIERCKTLVGNGTRLNDCYRHFSYLQYYMHFVEIILSLSGYMLNVMYTATNEPAQTTKQFEIRTAQGLARFLACTKCFRDGFYRNGRTGHWVPMKHFKFPIAGAHCKIQKGCPRKSGKFPNFKT